ncbi:MAG: SGNH/GDSL hydrolase family protein [Bacteroidales bacterium]|nr:SGNH/GDSL hydrolase family protein [Bacteroidales bacterium]
MKYLFSKIAVAALMLLCAASASAQDKWTGIARYAASNARLIATPAPAAGRIVLLGNSITDFWPSKCPEFFAQHPQLVPRGISGQTSYQMLVRFREDVVNLHPVAVVINCGTNDIAENGGIPYVEDNTFGNILSMVEIAKANGIKVYLSSVLPCATMYWAPKRTGVADKIAALNARIQRYAQQNGITYIDYFTPMVHGTDRALNPAYTTDGVHPTEEGYRQVMQPVLIKAIEKEIRD